MIFGAGIFALGAIQLVKPHVVFPGVILYGGGALVSQLWTLVVGVLTWRRADAAGPRRPRAVEFRAEFNYQCTTTAIQRGVLKNHGNNKSR